MFIVENGKITSEKTLDLGKLRSVDIAFAFDVSFEDTDKFELCIADNKNTLYGFTKSGKLNFADVDFSFIAEAEKTVTVIIKHNGTEILADEITVTAVVSGGGGGGMQDLSNYKGKINLDGESAVQINAQYDLQLNALDLRYNGNLLNSKGGLVRLDDVENLPLTCNDPQIEYKEVGSLVQCLSDNRQIQLYKLRYGTVQFQENINFPMPFDSERRCCTQEIWITSPERISTFSIPSTFQVIGDMPQSLAPDEIHCFVVRSIYLNNNFTLTLAYSHSFTAN